MPHSLSPSNGRQDIPRHAGMFSRIIPMTPRWHLPFVGRLLTIYACMAEGARRGESFVLPSLGT